MNLLISSATHRSGSTLVQRIFNARKKTLIWGEHQGCLTDFYRIHAKVHAFSLLSKKERENYFNSNEDPNHWIARMTPTTELAQKAIIDSVQAFFNTLYSQYRSEHDIIGFKEVRYGEAELTLFSHCYPNAAIVLLVRNPIHVWKSHKKDARISWYDGSILNYTKKWNNNASYYLKFSKEYQNAHLIQYEDLVARNPKTLELVCQLGMLSLTEIHYVLDKKIGSVNDDISKKDHKIIKEQCGKIMKLFGYQ